MLNIINWEVGEGRTGLNRETCSNWKLPVPTSTPLPSQNGLALEDGDGDTWASQGSNALVGGPLSREHKAPQAVWREWWEDLQ